MTNKLLDLYTFNIVRVLEIDLGIESYDIDTAVEVIMAETIMTGLTLTRANVREALQALDRRRYQKTRRNLHVEYD